MQGVSFCPTQSTCKTVVSSELDNQNPTVSTKLDDQSMTEEPDLVQAVINGHAADLVINWYVLLTIISQKRRRGLTPYQIRTKKMEAKVNKVVHVKVVLLSLLTLPTRVC